MNLSDFLSADRTVVPLEATTLPAATTALLERLAAAGVVSDAAKLAGRVDEERPEDVVGMGDRAFLVHWRSDAFSELAVALGTAARPICRELGEGGEGEEQPVQCARIVLLLVAPPRMSTQYLQLLGAFARFFAKQERVDAVLAHASAGSLVRAPELVAWDIPEQLLVRDLMTQRPRAVSPDTPIRQAALEMVRLGIGGLPVVDAESRIVGMLGLKELLRHLQSNYLQGAGGHRPPPAPAGAARRLVRDVMTRQVLCVSPDQPVAEVASIMTNKDVDRVPVVKGGKLVGFLTRGDIVRKLIGS